MTVRAAPAPDCAAPPRSPGGPTVEWRGRRAGAGPGPGPGSRLPVSVVALSAAVGVLVVAAADTAGRLGQAGSPWAVRAYWLGQALIVVPVAARLLTARTLSDRGTASLVVVLTAAEYLVKVCYSPAEFTYTDELEHWRSTVNLLHTGRLFTGNDLLPISPHYPGLEEVTAALVSVTGLPVFAAGLIVAGIAHLLFVCLLYLFFRQLSSARFAGVAVLFYSSNPQLQSFDSLFAYQTLAVAFLGLAMLAARRLTTSGPARARVGWLIVAAVAIAATVVTHHVTSYILVAALILVLACCLITGGRRAAAQLAVLALAAVAVIVGWVAWAAPGTVSYLQPVADDALGGARAMLGGGGSGAAASSLSAEPLGNQVLGAAAVMVMSALVLVGVWRVWRRYRDQPWLVAMAAASLGWYAIVIIRLAVPDGSELSGRASTFVFVPAAFVVALAVDYLVGLDLPWRASASAAAAVAAALVLLFDGLANGWPPYWERLPGSYQVAGVERAVEPEETAAAGWALAALGPGNRFAADFGSYPILGSYGDQNPVYDDAYLYTTPGYTRADASQVQAEAIGYILVDRRLSRSLPVSGTYFPGVTGQYTHPLALAGLTKFNRIPGIGRLYDSGDIVIYDLKGSEYYAP